MLSLSQIFTVAAMLSLCGGNSAFAADALPEAVHVPSPVSPKDSLKYLHVHPKLRVELIAAEPEISDPVAIAFDEKGRLWVAEMPDYPNGPAEGETPTSRIRILDDRDGDGYFETAHTFAEHLLFANSVLPWQGGAIVTLSGQIAYFRDNDGDDKADVRETWFSGFAEQNSQLRANDPTFALDNHIYIANGLRGGTVVAVKKEWARGAKPVSISGMDFRFDSRTGQYEAVSGNCEFGLTFDDFGNRFVSSNRNPCRHIVLEDRYLKRNPFFGIPSVLEEVSPPGEASHVYPLAQAWTTSTLHQGQFTAACGVTLYRGNALPAEFQGNSFTCEPTAYLVHRDILSAAGSTFHSTAGRPGVEFLASQDEWFRPVNLANGPDGAFYVVDMYRAVIEHPQFMPDELKQRPDLNYGNDRGRIYRIVAAGETRSSHQAAVDLSAASSAELVDLLQHPNAWQRQMAARLLYERQDRSVRNRLETLATKGTSPLARIHALWTLKGLDCLALETVQTALVDRSTRVREQAVRLAEPWLRENQLSLDVSQTLGTFNDARLRLQVALSLGERQNPVDVPQLASIAWAGRTDHWTRAAVFSSLPVNDAAVTPVLSFLVPILEKAVRQQDARSDAIPLIQETFELIGARQNAEEIRGALTALCGTNAKPSETKVPAPTLQVAGLLGLGHGLRRRGRSLQSFLNQPANSSPESLRTQVKHVFQQAGQAALDQHTGSANRLAAIELLQFSDYTTAAPFLKQLFQETKNQQIRLADIGSFARFRDPEISTVLLEDYFSQTPAVRRAILDAMLANVDRTNHLLDQIASGNMAMSELDLTRQNRLLRHRDLKLRKRAKELMASSVPADRQTVLKEYHQALSLKSDPYHGRDVFQKHCTTCHQIGDLGVNVAPDIADSRVKKPEQLLTSIIDPNRAVDSNYFSYTVITLQGKVFTGIISNETATSVTLRQEENKTATLLRQDIDEMRSNGVSLMPVGLEKNIPVQDMADVISFIKNWRYLDGRVPIQPGAPSGASP